MLDKACCRTHRVKGRLGVIANLAVRTQAGRQCFNQNALVHLGGVRGYAAHMRRHMPVVLKIIQSLE